MKRAVFFDRDGVLVKNINGEAPINVSDLQIIPTSISTVKKIQDIGYQIIIVSNQPDIALGKISEEVKKNLAEKFLSLLSKSNLFVNGIYYCFHHPKGTNKKYSKNCSCRKPKPGMIINASIDHKITLKESYIVGDRATDIKAGNMAGLKTILLDPKGKETIYLSKYDVTPDFTVKKISEILKIL